MFRDYHQGMLCRLFSCTWCFEMFALKVKHGVLIVQVIMKESSEGQSDKCQWISGVNLPFQSSNWVFLPLWFKNNKTSQVQMALSILFFSMSYHSSLELILFIPHMEKEQKKTNVSKTPNGHCKVATWIYSLGYFGCSWLHVFIYSQFITH